MRVELLWWEGCPSYPEAIAEVRELMREEGLDADALELREIETEEQAASERFPGSPTIRIDGEDIVFGEVRSGMEAVDSIEGTETGAQDRPTEDAVIERVEVHAG